MIFSFNVLSDFRSNASLPIIILILSNVSGSRNSGNQFKVVI